MFVILFTFYQATAITLFLLINVLVFYNVRNYINWQHFSKKEGLLLPQRLQYCPSASIICL